MKNLFLKIFILFLFYSSATCKRKIIDLFFFKIKFEEPNFYEWIDKIEDRLPSWLFIFPGTKWCGVGDIAYNETDFGEEIETDKCCYAHDNCPDIIEAYETKYNLTNPTFYTRLNCHCDMEFYKCLKLVNTTTAHRVGYLYFTTLKTKCFKQRILRSIPLVDEITESKYNWIQLPSF